MMEIERGDLILGGFVAALMAVAVYPMLDIGGTAYQPSEKCAGTATALEQQWGANYSSVSCDCSPASKAFRRQLDTPQAVQNVSLRLEELSCTIKDESFPGGKHTVTVAIRTIEGTNSTDLNASITNGTVVR